MAVLNAKTNEEILNAFKIVIPYINKLYVRISS